MSSGGVHENTPVLKSLTEISSFIESRGGPKISVRKPIVTTSMRFNVTLSQKL